MTTRTALSHAVLDIQNAMIAAPCFADFTVTHVEAWDDAPEKVRVAYTLANDADAIGQSAAVLDTLEERHGLSVEWSGPTGDGFGIVWTR